MLYRASMGHYHNAEGTAGSQVLLGCVYHHVAVHSSYESGSSGNITEERQCFDRMILLTGFCSTASLWKASGRQSICHSVPVGIACDDCCPNGWDVGRRDVSEVVGAIADDVDTFSSSVNQN